MQLLRSYQRSDYDLTVFSDYYGIRAANMSKWIKQFLLAGLARIIRSKHNQHYSMDTKIAAVKEYLAGNTTNQVILNRYKIRNITQLHYWVILRNSDQLN
ncbi:hypothetical protein LTY36_04835 [Limosilactobacillus agrestis]|uniref:Transposase n=2 Tax=Limosilactobacillus agrestis TaxID=2759748 RepID=A0ABS8R781_9LACO|nr:hypothetical protein [Limosilactobacillus agrestis]